MSTARAVVVRAIILSIGSLPFISWSLSAATVARPVVVALDRWFSFQCHGRLDRSLALADHYFPVCSRCLGIYGGLVLAAIVAQPQLSPLLRRAWILGGAALMIAEVLIQDRTGHPPIHALRLLTGVLLAYPVALTAIDAARDRATAVREPASQAAR